MMRHGISSELYNNFKLSIEKSYGRGTSFQQLMSSLITLNVQKKDSKFKAGSKIYLTVGNFNKSLESILLQVFSTINPEFKCLASILKKWICDLAHPQYKHKFQYKWISIIFVLIFYLQQKKLLPILDEEDLVKIHELLLQKNVNFTEQQSIDSLERLQRQPINKNLQTFVNTFHSVLIPQDILTRIGSIQSFLKKRERISIEKMESNSNLGETMINFIGWITNDLSDPQSPIRNIPISILTQNTKSGNN